MNRHAVRPGSASLRQVLVSLGAPLADLIAAPAGLDVEINDVVILDPDDDPDSYDDDLVLIIGSQGRTAARLVRDAAQRGASAVAVKVPAGDATDSLWATAHDAQVAVLAVRIEDSANRVLAYSKSDDKVDERRRLSLLGREGPAAYLTKLREWRVFDRLSAGGDVVCVDERPELGIRRRLAIGIRADSELLGSIWVQEGVLVSETLGTTAQSGG